MLEERPPNGITRRQALAGTAAAAVASLASPRLGSAELRDQTPARAKSPNLLFVFTDQQSFDMLGANGNTQVLTPHLDRFASESVNVQSAFVTAPLCTPCRGILLSGRHPLANGSVDNNWQLRPDEDNVGHVFKRAGYRTGYIGKWHLYGGYWDRPVPPGEHRHGFDVFQTNNCDLNFTPENAYFWNEKGDKQRFGQWEQTGQTDQAIDFIRDSHANEDPFALFLSWHPPHNHRTLDHYASYDAPKDCLDRYDFNEVQTRWDAPDDELHKTMMHGHMALTSACDDEFERLLKTLDDLGIAEDTVVVFTSDHGDMLKFVDGRRFVKIRPEPTSSQVPLLIRYPRKLSPGKTNLLVGTLDLVPTVMSLMGIRPPASYPGHDLTSALERGDGEAVSSIPLFMQTVENWRGCVTPDYIYGFDAYGRDVEQYPFSTNVLIDRRNDPEGRVNLFGKPEAKAMQADAHRLTREWCKRFDDPYTRAKPLRDACLPQAADRRQVWLDHHDRESSGMTIGRPVDVIRAAGIEGAFS